MKVRVSQFLLAALSLLVAAGCATAPIRAAKVAPYHPAVKALDVRTPQRGQPAATNAAAPQAAPLPGEAPLAEEPAVRTLMPGDRLQITLRVYPKTDNFESVIDENGCINLDLVGRINVGGKTSAEAEKAVEKAYVDGQFYKTITVSIIPPVREFFVKGYVLRPGNYPINRAKMTVLQALSMAGGWNEFADPNKVRLVRGGDVMILNIPKIQARTETDVYIEPGDVIDVPKRWM